MGDAGSIGVCVRRLRRDRGMSQQDLAEQAGVSVSIIQKLEQGRRSSARTSTLIALANALDTDLSDLTGKRPRLERGEDASVLALRDVLLSPDLVMDPDPSGAPAPLGELVARVDRAFVDYWSGRFSHLASVLPGLVVETRLAHDALGPTAAGPLAQSYQLAASLLVHLGKGDLAALAAERSIRAAADGDDELLWATVHGTFAYALLQQGRTEASERHAMWIAGQIEPSLSRATPEHLTVWGAVVLWAMAAAVAGGRGGAAVDYIGLARSAAGRFEDDRHDYYTNFGPTQVAMQATHAHAMLGETGRALRAARDVRREHLRPISWGRHLIDVAQAQVDARDHHAAQETLLEANEMSTEWFRHQVPARALVRELVQEARRLSQPLRQLAQSAGVDH